MYTYEIVRVNSTGVINYTEFDDNEVIIKKYASYGFRYVGYIPVKMHVNGGLSAIDLIFEKKLEDQDE